MTNEIVRQIPLHDRFALGNRDFSGRELFFQVSPDSIVGSDSFPLVREILHHLPSHLQYKPAFNLMEQQFRTFEVELHGT